MENKTGKLLPGYYADIAILSHNLFEIPSEEIKNVRVMRTVVNGKEVYKN